MALQARQVAGDSTRRVLAKRLANGDVAVALFNQSGATATISTTAAAIGKTGSSFTLRDAWTNATTGTTGAISATVPAHGTVVYRVSSGGTVPSNTGALVSAASSRCLDLPQSNAANGTQPVIWDCNGGANQRWTLDGQTIRALGKCLDAPLNAAAGAKAQIWDCNGGANQRWTLDVRRHRTRRAVRALPGCRPEPDRQRHRRVALDLHGGRKPTLDVGVVTGTLTAATFHIGTTSGTDGFVDDVAIQ